MIGPKSLQPLTTPFLLESTTNRCHHHDLQNAGIVMIGCTALPSIVLPAPHARRRFLRPLTTGLYGESAT